jgi:2-phosphosulfolactate phosphatase
MRYLHAALPDCAHITGPAVAIDVLRAFTTAAYLFEAGVSQIILVSGVDEAFALRSSLPGSLILGEIDGIQVQGFDLGNSPSDISRCQLRGKTIIQRTTAGTQGVIRAAHAGPIFAAALTNASATVRAIHRLAPDQITFIVTGFLPGENGTVDWGDEDKACADLIQAYLSDQETDRSTIAARVRASRSGLHYDGTRPAFPPTDLDMALDIDRFSFAMQVAKQNGLHYLRAIEV